jgi:hypothetical protein
MHRPQAGTTGARCKRSRFSAGLLSAVFALAAVPAFASPITIGGANGPSFSVDPIYFSAFNVSGLSGPGAGPDYFATSPVPFISVGNQAGVDLTVSQSLKTPVYQHPQDPSNSMNTLTNGGLSTAPTAATPFVADSRWTLKNTSGHAVDDILLLFTKATGATGYPAVDVALDDYTYKILEYHSQTAGTLYYGALPLGSLAPGAEVSFWVRYIVADPLLFDGVRNYIMPPFGLSALGRGSYIPEPGTAALLFAGLGLLRLRARGAKA